MLIDIYCLKGDPHKMEQAEIVGTLIRKQVFKFDDILELITNIYQDVNTPFPYIGNVEANSKGLIIPSVGNFFFWVILSKTSDVIVLDDFGASLTISGSLPTSGRCLITRPPLKDLFHITSITWLTTSMPRITGHGLWLTATSYRLLSTKT